MDVLIKSDPIVISAGFASRQSAVISHPVLIMDRNVLDAGVYQISDTTVLKLGAEVPRRARVYLLESRGKRQVAATTSDDEGRYVFKWLANRAYDIIAEDIAGTYRSVIANNVLPVPMP